MLDTTQVFAIEETTAVPAVTASYISLPTFFLDEKRQSYRATVECYDADKKLCGRLEVKFTQEEYDAWGTDSKYIYDLIHEKLGTKPTQEELIDL